MKLTIQECYQILGLSSSADEAEIKRAYRRLAFEYHPDRYQDIEKKKEAEEKFKLINEAYQRLIKGDKATPFANLDEVFRFYNEAMNEINRAYDNLIKTLEVGFARIEEHILRMNYLLGEGLFYSIKKIFSRTKKRKEYDKSKVYEAYKKEYKEDTLSVWLIGLTDKEKEELDYFLLDHLKGFGIIRKEEKENNKKRIYYIGCPFLFFGKWHYVLLYSTADYTYLYLNLPQDKLTIFDEKLQLITDLAKKS